MEGIRFSGVMETPSPYKLSYAFRFSARTHPAVFWRFDEIVRHLSAVGEINVRFRKGRRDRLSMEDVFNSVVLHFLELPLEQQHEIVRTQLAVFQALLDGGEKAKLPGLGHKAQPLKVKPATEAKTKTAKAKAVKPEPQPRLDGFEAPGGPSQVTARKPRGKSDGSGRRSG